MTMGESEYDLQALTRRLIRTRKQWSAGDLADAVLAATPRRALRAAYRTALGAYVRQALGSATTTPPTEDPRPGHISDDTQGSTAGAGTNPGVDDHRSPETHTAPVVSAGAPRSRASLFRASGFREIIHTGPGVYKSLAESSAEELLFAAAESDRHAESNAAAAERYRKLVKLMQEYDAQTPADLPEDVIAEEFSA